MKKAAVVYQFCILGAIVGLTVYFAITTKELNDTLVGALIGVMAGLSLRTDDEVEGMNKRKGETDDENI